MKFNIGKTVFDSKKIKIDLLIIWGLLLSEWVKEKAKTTERIVP
jgi:hypothetical protein